MNRSDWWIGIEMFAHLSEWDRSGLSPDSNSPFMEIIKDEEVKKLLIRHYIQDILILGRSTYLFYEELPPEMRDRLDAEDEELFKELEEKIRSRREEIDLPGWLSLILFGQWKVLPQEEEILRRAPPGWIKAKIMDELQFQEAQMRELKTAEKGGKRPRVGGETYKERVAKGELRKFAQRYEEYERYMDEKIRLGRIPPVQFPEG